MYASPDKTPHTLHASIYVLGSAIFIFSVYYNIDNSIHVVLKWILTIIGAFFTYGFLTLSYLAAFSKRPQDEIDINAAFIFLIAGLLIGVGTLFMFKNTRKRVIHE
jgi:hypothetical protein